MLQKAYTDIHKEIIELSKSGNESAQYQLYSLYAKSMYNICMRMLGLREEAEDALQEAFTVIFEKLDTFRFESSFGAWTKRIVINTCLNNLSKRKIDLCFNEEINTEVFESDNNSNDNLELEVKEVHRAINKLPEGYRIILSMYLLEGYDHKEISDILNISESTSRTQYMKAKKKVREYLTNPS